MITFGTMPVCASLIIHVTMVHNESLAFNASIRGRVSLTSQDTMIGVGFVRLL
jgi:hypothetical protein